MINAKFFLAKINRHRVKRVRSDACNLGQICIKLDSRSATNDELWSCSQVASSFAPPSNGATPRPLHMRILVNNTFVFLSAILHSFSLLFADCKY